MRTAARTTAQEAEGFSLSCSTNVVLGGQSRRGARADCGAYCGTYGDVHCGAGSSGILKCRTGRTQPEGRESGLRRVRRHVRRFSLNCSTNAVLGGQSRRGARADCGAYGGAGS